MANDPRKTTWGWSAPPQTENEPTVVMPQAQQQMSQDWQQYLAAKAAWDQQQLAWQQSQQQAYAQQQDYAQQQLAQQQLAQQQLAWQQAQAAQQQQQQQYDYAQQQQQMQMQHAQYAQTQLAPQPAYPQPYPQPPPQQAYVPPPEPVAAASSSPYPVQSRPSSEPPPAAAPPLRDHANATVGVSQRVRFIRLTYLHLLLAILTFAGLEYLLNTNPFLVAHVSVPLTTWSLTGRNWGGVLVAFMAVSWVADYYASHTSARAAQYFGLFLYICAEALIFVPLLAIVAWRTQDILAAGGTEPHILRDAAVTTIGVFVMLTLSVFVSKKDFSFMRSGLMMVGGAALALIFLSIGFGFELGLAFSVAMVLFAAGNVLYQTSQVLAHYDPRSHVAASLALFSSVALMFWYVIRIFLKMRQ
jgi:hypothetical protein|nr:Bax inhibitor-1 family protein [Kofleriaceae bacterium]